MEQFSNRSNPPDDLCFWVNSLAMASMRSLAGRFSRYGITPHQFAILMMCSEGCVDTVSGLARVMPLDAAAVSRNVHNLVQQELLEREPSQRDRRSATLSVTESGKVLLEELAAHVDANDRMLLRGIDDAERDKFVTTIKTMLANTAAYEATRL